MDSEENPTRKPFFYDLGYDPRYVTLTSGHPDTHYHLSGYLTQVPEVTFSAKVYDLGSPFGIEGGRVSKLTMCHDGYEILNYSRGWDETPETMIDRAYLRELLRGFAEDHVGREYPGMSADFAQGAKKQSRGEGADERYFGRWHPRARQFRNAALEVGLKRPGRRSR